ncbi:hypothetical protein CRG98_042579, partial [Punica granatum]
MPPSRGFTLFEKNRGRSVNKKNSSDNLGCWEVGRTVPKGWTGPTVSNWAEWAAGPNGLLNRTGLGSGLDWAELDWIGPSWAPGHKLGRRASVLAAHGRRLYDQKNKSTRLEQKWNRGEATRSGWLEWCDTIARDPWREEGGRW